MVSVRNFWLENDLGQKFSLMSKHEDVDGDTGTFLHNPTGLGVAYTNTYSKLGNDNIKINTEMNMLSIEGDLIFKHEDSYLAFNLFVASSNVLKFYQQLPFDLVNTDALDESYLYCEVSLNSIQKSDKEDDVDILICPVSFDKQTPWRTPVLSSQFLSGGSSTGNKIYSYTYDDQGKTSPVYGAASRSKVTIINYGTFLTYPKITLTGAVTNPFITIIDFNTQEIEYQMFVDISVLVGETLIINSDPRYFYVEKDGTNVFDNVSLEYESELIIKPGKKIIEITQSASADIGSALIEYQLEFGTV